MKVEAQTRLGAARKDIKEPKNKMLISYSIQQEPKFLLIPNNQVCFETIKVARVEIRY